MKLLLIGNLRADRYAATHRLTSPDIVRAPADADRYFPHPLDTLIYFGDEAEGTMDELWARGFKLRNSQSPALPPPPQQSLNL